MKFLASIIVTVAVIVAYGDLFAHGSEGSRSSEANQPALKFNVDARSTSLPEYRAEPNMKLSVDGQTIRLDISEPDGKSIDTEFADAKIFVTTGDGISTLYLWPSNDGGLSGKGDFNPEPGMRVEVLLHLPDREIARREFYPLDSDK